MIGRVVGTLVKTTTIFPEQFFDAFQKSLNVLLATNPSRPADFWDLLSKFVWSVYREYVSDFKLSIRQYYIYILNICVCKFQEFLLWDLRMASPKIISIEKGFDFLLAMFMEKVEDSNEVHIVKKLWTDAGNMNLTDWMSADEVLSLF